MRTWRRMVGHALADPRKAAVVIAAVASLVVVAAAAFVVLVAPAAPSHPAAAAASSGTGASAGGPTATAGAPEVAASARASDRPVIDRLAVLARRLATGPMTRLAADLGPALSSATNPGGIGRRYTPDPSGALIRGEFFQQGASGTCYLVTFAADRSWLTLGDLTGLRVTGPVAADATSCAPSATP